MRPGAPRRIRSCRLPPRRGKKRVPHSAVLTIGGRLGSAAGIIGAAISDPEVGFPAWVDLTGVVAGFGVGFLAAGLALLVASFLCDGPLVRDPSGHHRRWLGSRLRREARYRRGVSGNITVEAQSLRYVHVHDGTDGDTHFEDVQVDLEPAPFAPPAPPIAVSDSLSAAAVVFFGVPEAWFGDFHPAPHRQFCVICEGHLEVETTDGEVHRFSSASSCSSRTSVVAVTGHGPWGRGSWRECSCNSPTVGTAKRLSGRLGVGAIAWASVRE
jgi:hypothetical protein